MQDPANEFLAGYSAEIQAVSQALRAMVKRAMPRAIEVVFASQQYIGYGLTAKMNDRVCYLCPMREYVRLGFMYGGYLPDPERRLQGEGKRLRHVKVRTLTEASDPALERLVEAAGADAEARLAQK